MGNKGFIICIDDEQSVLNQLSGQLALKFGENHEIEIAESAEEALELIDDLIQEENEAVELLICDQIMPGMKGDQFLEKIDKQYPDIKKILLTGQAGLESAINAINNANLDKYVEKPWEIEDLSLTIKILLEQFSLKREIAQYNKTLEKKNRDLETLHQIGIKLNSIQEINDLTQAVIKASVDLTSNNHIIYFHKTGIDKKPPVVAGEYDPDAINALWDGYSSSVENALKAGISITINHGESSDYFAKPLKEQFDFLNYTVWLPVSTNEKFLGAICLIFERPIVDQLTSTLSILANQYASTLYNIELTSDKIKSERLATIGQMISSIIHDFKNPMTTIKGLVGLMGESDFTLEERKLYSDMVIEEVDRVVGMVNELLEFSRGGRGQLRKSDILFNDLLEKICTIYDKEFSDKGISLETNFSYIGNILIDTEKFKRALFNIIDNARDAMQDGGVFKISTAQKDDHVELFLQDSGSGMPVEVMNNIFEPFVTHGKIHGTGLGMAITKKIIDDHKGFIKVESEPGVGTTFTIRLPLT